MKMIKMEYTGSAPFREVPGVGRVTKGQEFEMLDYMAASLLKSGEFREVRPVQRKPAMPMRAEPVKKMTEVEKSVGGEK